MHPYELRSVIQMTHKDDFLRLKSGSLYNSIDRLLEAGLIEVQATAREGRRPERTVYRITARGRSEALQWLRELLQNPDPDPTRFYAALSFLPALEPRDVIRRLEQRIAHLTTEIDGYREGLPGLTARIGRLNLVEVEFALALREAERQWVSQIVEDLRADRLTWEPAGFRRLANQFLRPGTPAARM